MFYELPDEDLSSALESLRELEQNISDSIIQRRSSKRLDISTKVLIRHGNSSERDQFMMEGMTGDISDGGCLVVSSTPTMAGDIYWLDFSEGSAASLGAVFARSMRCRFISEGTFENGFRFFNNVDVQHMLS